jgi:hypothetical protein
MRTPQQRMHSSAEDMDRPRGTACVADQDGERPSFGTAQPQPFSFSLDVAHFFRTQALVFLFQLSREYWTHASKQLTNKSIFAVRLIMYLIICRFSLFVCFVFPHFLFLFFVRLSSLVAVLERIVVSSICAIFGRLSLIQFKRNLSAATLASLLS